jgi:hypothetical protein
MTGAIDRHQRARKPAGNEYECARWRYGEKRGASIRSAEHTIEHGDRCASKGCRRKIEQRGVQLPFA